MAKMFLDGAQLSYVDKDGAPTSVAAKGRTFQIGSSMGCDLLLTEDRVERLLCEIKCDAFGKVTIHNYSKEHTIELNGQKLEVKRPLLHGTRLTILNRVYLWEFPKVLETERDNGTEPETPDRALPAEHAPNSCPSLRVNRRPIENRLTVHNFKYSINSDDEGNTSLGLNDLDESERCVSPANDVDPITDDVPKVDLLESTQNKENTSSPPASHKKLLQLCARSDVVLTSFSPRTTGVRAEKSFTCVMKPQTPKSVYGTPKSVLSEVNEDSCSRDLVDFSTPSTSKALGSVRRMSSMYLIDLTTPQRLKSTPRQTTPSTSSDSSAVIEISSSDTPQSVAKSRLARNPKLLAAVGSGATPKRTPQSLMKRALLTSAKKQILARTPMSPSSSPSQRSSLLGIRRQSMTTPRRLPFDEHHKSTPEKRVPFVERRSQCQTSPRKRKTSLSLSMSCPRDNKLSQQRKSLAEAKRNSAICLSNKLVAKARRSLNSPKIGSPSHQVRTPQTPTRGNLASSTPDAKDDSIAELSQTFTIDDEDEEDAGKNESIDDLRRKIIEKERRSRDSNSNNSIANPIDENVDQSRDHKLNETFDANEEASTSCSAIITEAIIEDNIADEVIVAVESESDHKGDEIESPKSMEIIEDTICNEVEHTPPEDDTEQLVDVEKPAPPGETPMPTRSTRRFSNEQTAALTTPRRSLRRASMEASNKSEQPKRRASCSAVELEIPSLVATPKRKRRLTAESSTPKRQSKRLLSTPKRNLPVDEAVGDMAVIVEDQDESEENPIADEDYGTELPMITTSDETDKIDYHGLKDLLKTPKMCSTPRFKGLREMMKTPQVHASPILANINELMEEKPSSITIPGHALLGVAAAESKDLDRILKTPSAKNIMIPNDPASAILKSRADSVATATEYDLNVTNTTLHLDKIFEDIPTTSAIQSDSEHELSLTGLSAVTGADPLATSQKNANEVGDSSEISMNISVPGIVNSSKDPLTSTTYKVAARHGDQHKYENKKAPPRPESPNVSGIQLLDQTTDSMFSEPLVVSGIDTVEETRECSTTNLIDSDTESTIGLAEPLVVSDDDEEMDQEKNSKELPEEQSVIFPLEKSIKESSINEATHKEQKPSINGSAHSNESKQIVDESSIKDSTNTKNESLIELDATVESLFAVKTEEKVIELDDGSENESSAKKDTALDAGKQLGSAGKSPSKSREVETVSEAVKDAIDSEIEDLPAKDQDAKSMKDDAINNSQSSFTIKNKENSNGKELVVPIGEPSADKLTSLDESLTVFATDSSEVNVNGQEKNVSSAVLLEEALPDGTSAKEIAENNDDQDAKLFVSSTEEIAGTEIIESAPVADKLIAVEEISKKILKQTFEPALVPNELIADGITQNTSTAVEQINSEISTSSPTVEETSKDTQKAMLMKTPNETPKETAETAPAADLAATEDVIDSTDSTTTSPTDEEILKDTPKEIIESAPVADELIATFTESSTSSYTAKEIPTESSKEMVESASAADLSVTTDVTQNVSTTFMEAASSLTAEEIADDVTQNTSTAVETISTETSTCSPTVEETLKETPKKPPKETKEIAPVADLSVTKDASSSTESLTSSPPVEIMESAPVADELSADDVTPNILPTGEATSTQLSASSSTAEEMPIESSKEIVESASVADLSVAEDVTQSILTAIETNSTELSTSKPTADETPKKTLGSAGVDDLSICSTEQSIVEDSITNISIARETSSDEQDPVLDSRTPPTETSSIDQTARFSKENANEVFSKSESPAASKNTSKPLSNESSIENNSSDKVIDDLMEKATADATLETIEKEQMDTPLVSDKSNDEDQEVKPTTELDKSATYSTVIDLDESTASETKVEHKEMYTDLFPDSSTQETVTLDEQKDDVVIELDTSVASQDVSNANEEKVKNNQGKVDQPSDEFVGELQLSGENDAPITNASLLDEDSLLEDEEPICLDDSVAPATEVKREKSSPKELPRNTELNDLPLERNPLKITKESDSLKAGEKPDGSIIMLLDNDDIKELNENNEKVPNDSTENPKLDDNILEIKGNNVSDGPILGQQDEKEKQQLIIKMPVVAEKITLDHSDDKRKSVRSIFDVSIMETSAKGEDVSVCTKNIVEETSTLLTKKNVIDSLQDEPKNSSSVDEVIDLDASSGCDEIFMVESANENASIQQQSSEVVIPTSRVAEKANKLNVNQVSTEKDQLAGEEDFSLDKKFVTLPANSQSKNVATVDTASEMPFEESTSEIVPDSNARNEIPVGNLQSDDKKVITQEANNSDLKKQENSEQPSRQPIKDEVSDKAEEPETDSQMPNSSHLADFSEAKQEMVAILEPKSQVVEEAQLKNILEDETEQELKEKPLTEIDETQAESSLKPVEQIVEEAKTDKKSAKVKTKSKMDKESLKEETRSPENLEETSEPLPNRKQTMDESKTNTKEKDQMPSTEITEAEATLEYVEQSHTVEAPKINEVPGEEENETLENGATTAETKKAAAPIPAPVEIEERPKRLRRKEANDVSETKKKNTPEEKEEEGKKPKKKPSREITEADTKTTLEPMQQSTEVKTQSEIVESPAEIKTKCEIDEALVAPSVTPIEIENKPNRLKRNQAIVESEAKKDDINQELDAKTQGMLVDGAVADPGKEGIVQELMTSKSDEDMAPSKRPHKEKEGKEDAAPVPSEKEKPKRRVRKPSGNVKESNDEQMVATSPEVVDAKLPEVQFEDDVEQSKPRRRGRKPSAEVAQTNKESVVESMTQIAEEANHSEKDLAAPSKRRGRKPSAEVESNKPETIPSALVQSAEKPKRRGRKPSADVAEPEHPIIERMTQIVEQQPKRRGRKASADVLESDNESRKPMPRLAEMSTPKEDVTPIKRRGRKASVDVTELTKPIQEDAKTSDPEKLSAIAEVETEPANEQKAEPDALPEKAKTRRGRKPSAEVVDKSVEVDPQEVTIPKTRRVRKASAETVEENSAKEISSRRGGHKATAKRHVDDVEHLEEIREAEEPEAKRKLVESDSDDHHHSTLKATVENELGNIVSTRRRGQHVTEKQETSKPKRRGRRVSVEEVLTEAHTDASQEKPLPQILENPKRHGRTPSVEVEPRPTRRVRNASASVEEEAAKKLPTRRGRTANIPVDDSSNDIVVLPPTVVINEAATEKQQTTLSDGMVSDDELTPRRRERRNVMPKNYNETSDDEKPSHAGARRVRKPATSKSTSKPLEAERDHLLRTPQPPSTSTVVEEPSTPISAAIPTEPTTSQKRQVRNTPRKDYKEASDDEKPASSRTRRVRNPTPKALELIVDSSPRPGTPKRRKAAKAIAEESQEPPEKKAVTKESALSPVNSISTTTEAGPAATKARGNRRKVIETKLSDIEPEEPAPEVAPKRNARTRKGKVEEAEAVADKPLKSLRGARAKTPALTAEPSQQVKAVSDPEPKKPAARGRGVRAAAAKEPQIIVAPVVGDDITIASTSSSSQISAVPARSGRARKVHFEAEPTTSDDGATAPKRATRSRRK